MNEVFATTIPDESALHSQLTDADFCDAWSTSLRDSALTPPKYFCAPREQLPPGLGERWPCATASCVR